MTEEELKIALEQNGSASAVLLKEAFDILNSKISGISAQDPRIVGAVSAQSPATLGTNVEIGNETQIASSVKLGQGVKIGENGPLIISFDAQGFGARSSYGSVFVGADTTGPYMTIDGIIYYLQRVDYPLSSV